MAAHAAERVDAAIAEYTEALISTPTIPSFITTWVFAFAAKGDLDLAVQHYLAAPCNSNLRYDRARANLVAALAKASGEPRLRADSNEVLASKCKHWDGTLDTLAA